MNPGARRFVSLQSLISWRHKTMKAKYRLLQVGLRTMRSALLFVGFALHGSCKTYDPTQSSGTSGSLESTQKTDSRTTAASSSALGTSSSEKSSQGELGVTTMPKGPSQECTPGVQTQCSEDPLGSIVLFPGSVPRGNCRYGQKTCLVNGRWGACVGVIGPAPTDDCSVSGDDANCNGAPNDGCDCLSTPGAQRACGSDVGVCKKGVQHCVNGSWGACIGETSPLKEACDGMGLDEDCDGSADVNDSDCDCVHGQAEACIVAGAIGDCSLGERRCASGKMGPCLALFDSLPERCGQAEPDTYGRATGDEDCDGLVDEEEGPRIPIGCKIYIEDMDGDSWGAIGPSYIEDQEHATHGCFCKPPSGRLSHFVPVWRRDRENTDCGDCALDGRAVIPTSTWKEEEPSACLQRVGWKGGVHDLNCNGVEEPESTELHQGKCQGDPESAPGCFWSPASTGRWIGKVPACGEYGDVPKCLTKGEPGSRFCVTSVAGEHGRAPQACN